jgi:hypothetical protein
MAGSMDKVIRDPIYGNGSKTSYTGTAGSATISKDSQSVLVWCSTVAYVRIGTTATTADLPIPANAPIILPVPLSVQNGQAITVSAIQDTTGGSLYCIGLAE